jgi:hypothetical protein
MLYLVMPCHAPMLYLVMPCHAPMLYLVMPCHAPVLYLFFWVVVCSHFARGLQHIVLARCPPTLATATGIRPFQLLLSVFIGCLRWLFVIQTM